MSDTAADAALRVAVVGTGRFGALHARTWQEAGAAIVGIADVDADRLEEVAGRIGVTETSVSVEDLLRRTTPDAVVVATDEDSHVPVTELAIEAGCHVLVEKPFAMRSSDARRVAALARSRGLEVIAGHISRFAQPYLSVRDALAAGRVGDLWSLRLRRDFSRDWFDSFGERVNPVWESCIHDIDLALYFTAARPTRVMAMRSEAAGKAAPSVVSALVEFDTGVLTTIETAWTIPGRAPQTESGALELPGSIVGEAEAHGSAGVVKQRLLNDGLTVWSDDAAWSPNPFLWPLVQGAVGGALRNEIAYAMDVFAGRRQNDVMPMDQAVASIVLAEAFVESLGTGQPVLIAPEKAPPS